MGYTLSDLNQILFDSLDRLNNDNLRGEDLQEEITRADGIGRVAARILNNAELQLEAKKHMDEYGYTERERNMPALLGLNNGEK